MGLVSVDVKYFKMAVGLERIGRETTEDVQAKCPVCGDSKTKTSAKRLHLYNKGTVTNVNCFNGDCLVHNKTVYGFLNEFFPNLLSQYKRETFQNTLTELSNGGDVFASFKKTTKTTNKHETAPTSEPKDSLLDSWEPNDVFLQIPKPPVQVQDLTMYMQPIEESKHGIDYLKTRGIEPNTKFGKWFFGDRDLKIGETLYRITDSVVVPLYYKDVMYGFYSRSTETKNFTTYMNNTNIGYKIFNWFNVDLEEPVYIFEGVFDAIASGLPNSIALLGAKLPDERLKEIKKPIFCLDNDRTGIINSVQYAKKGHSIFIQPKQFKEKDMNELMLNYGSVCDLVKNNIKCGIIAEVELTSRL